MCYHSYFHINKLKMGIHFMDIFTNSDTVFLVQYFNRLFLTSVAFTSAFLPPLQTITFIKETTNQNNNPVKKSFSRLNLVIFHYSNT